MLLAMTCILASVAYAAETPLTNGVPLTGLSGTAGSETFYRIDVPAGQDQLDILTTGGTGDVDLYVRRGALPTTMWTGPLGALQCPAGSSILRRPACHDLARSSRAVWRAR